jgi:hypothetical protein
MSLLKNLIQKNQSNLKNANDSASNDNKNKMSLSSARRKPSKNGLIPMSTDHTPKKGSSKESNSTRQ